MLINILVIFTLLMLYAFYKSRYERTQCIDLIFFGIWIVFALEYYATTDYPVYYENFDRTYIHVIWEPGYRLLLQLFQPFGFFVFNACVAAFEIYTLCYMFKRFCPPAYVWLGILIFMLDVNNMFGYMCLKRQFFAMAIGLWTLYFTCWSTARYRWIYAALTFFASIMIHTSAIVTAAYFIVPFMKWRINWVSGLMLLALFVWGLTFNVKDYIDELANIYSSAGGDSVADGRYEEYIDNMDDAMFGNMFSKLGMSITAILYVLNFLVMVWYSRRVTQKEYRLVLVSIASFILGNVLISDFYRLNHYFSIVNFFTIPIVADLLVKDARCSKTLYYKMLMYGCFTLWMLVPCKVYFETFTGSRVAYMNVRYKHFPTIFDENADKSIYLYDGYREID